MRRTLRPAFLVLLGILAARGIAAAGGAPTALEPWSKGTLDFHQISTGRGNAAFVVFPDGTTLLFDVGDAGDFAPLATAFPDASRGAGEWVARYVKRTAGADAVLDYVVVSHFHVDHVGGLATLAPRVVIVPAWAPTHPSPDVLKRLLSKRIWPAPRDVFVTRLRDATKATIGPRAGQVASDAGHVVVRVAPGGASYRVFTLDDTNESGAVTSVHGPYASSGRR